MSATPMAVETRPFAVEPVTQVMLPDGIFDNAILNFDDLLPLHQYQRRAADQR